MRIIQALLPILFVINSTLPLTLAADALTYAEVTQRAEAAAREPFSPALITGSPSLHSLNYDTWRMLIFRKGRTVWAGSSHELQFFHPGYLFLNKVRINQITDNAVVEWPFSPKFFQYPDEPEITFGGDETFAGFKVLYNLNSKKRKDELLSFLGATYFRALGAGQRYGLSARGLAVNIGLPDVKEEFPVFREFWIEKPSPESESIRIFALLDSPSVAGSYQFDVIPGEETRMNVIATLFWRKKPTSVGIAPLTSMFWFGENTEHKPKDPRPEVHDSDGLAIADNSGVRWLPLANRSTITVRSLNVDNPYGFGLFQRDANIKNYDDSEAAYHLRPSVWVELVGDWSAGNVHLMELPTTNEYGDNVGAYWAPTRLPEAGETTRHEYRLYWVKAGLSAGDLYRVESTHVESLALGGKRFTITFKSGAIDGRPLPSANLTPEIQANSATVNNIKTTSVNNSVRVEFELSGAAGAIVEPTCILNNESHNVSEKWIYQTIL